MNFIVTLKKAKIKRDRVAVESVNITNLENFTQEHITYIPKIK